MHRRLRHNPDPDLEHLYEYAEFKRETIDDMVDVMKQVGAPGFFSSLVGFLEYVGGERPGMQLREIDDRDAQSIRAIVKVINRHFGVD